jgi:sporulation integral membrane protein YtvI
MFNQQFIKKAINFFIFIVVFTILFVLFFSTLSYTGPFVFAIFIAIITRPFTSFLKRKLRFSSSVAALVSTILVFVILSLLVTALFFKITIEAKTLLNSMPNVESVVKFFEDLLSELKVYYEKIDPSLTQKFTEEISTLSKTVIGMTTNVAKTLISTAIGLPVMLMVIFVGFLATYFFSKDLLRMEIKFTSIFSPKGKENVIAVWKESGKMVIGYFKSYTVVVSLTFLESFIGFSILNVKYALILSIACALLDVLPIIGISAVYLPLAIIYLSMGKYATAIGLIVLLTAITIIRQIIEPKLYASTLGLHPAAVLVAIFIGIKAYGFLGMIYLLCVMVLYKILRKVKVL